MLRPGLSEDSGAKTKMGALHNELKSGSFPLIPPIGTNIQSVRMCVCVCVAYELIYDWNTQVWTSQSRLHPHVLQTTTRVHWKRTERRSTAQNCQRTPTVMAPLYLKTPQRYKSLIRLNETMWRLDLIICFLFHLCSFYNRVPGKWNGRRRALTIHGMKSKISFLGSGIYFASLFFRSHLFVFNQQLSANECRTARGGRDHVGKWWTTHREPEL